LAKKRKRLIAALEREAVDRPPIWLMRQAGRYLPEYRKVRADAGSFLDLCYSPDLAAEVTLQPVRRFALDAAIIFSDILVIPDALGRPVAFREGEGPVLGAIADGELDRLRREGLGERLAPVYEAIGRVREALPADIALIGFAGAPWTIATYMIEGGTSRDFAATKRWAFGRPESFARLIGVLEEAVADHLIAQAAAGAEALQIFDSWAGMLPDGAFEAWCVEPIGRIVARVKEAAPDAPIIVFPRLAGTRYAAFATVAGVAGIGLDQTVARRWAANHLQPRLTIQGNLDPVYLVEGGAAMEREAEKILLAFRDGPFIFNLGHGVMQTTPPDNVAALCDLVASWEG
jgi:uroporphyrinogen decarboxylase